MFIIFLCYIVCYVNVGHGEYFIYSCVLVFLWMQNWDIYCLNFVIQGNLLALLKIIYLFLMLFRPFSDKIWCTFGKIEISFCQNIHNQVVDSNFSVCSCVSPLCFFLLEILDSERMIIRLCQMLGSSND